MKRSVSLLTLTLLVCCGVQAQDKNYQDTISGAAAPSSFDFNGDGLKAHHVTFSGQSSIGPVHGAFLVEYDFLNVAPNPACPVGQVRIPIIVSASTRATQTQEDQVFLKDDAASALFCLNPAAGSFTMALKGNFVGGMGRFAGATGTYEYKGSGQVLLQDHIGLPFGGFTLKTAGRLILP